DADALDRHVHRVGAVLPRPAGAAGAERIGALPAHRVPVGHREAQVLLHRFAFDPFVRVVVAEAWRGGASGGFRAEPWRLRGRMAWRHLKVGGAARPRYTIWNGTGSANSVEYGHHPLEERPTWPHNIPPGSSSWSRRRRSTSRS